MSDRDDLGTMPSTRRRFLTAGAVGVGVAVGGCADAPTEREIQETLTPVEVPRSDAEHLREAAEIETPSIPPVVVVTDDHLAAAARQVESVVESVHDLVSETEFEERPPGVPAADEVDRRLTEASADLDDVRAGEYGTAVEALESLRNILGRLAEMRGALEAADGMEDAEVEGLWRAVHRQRDAEAAVSDRVEYRVAAPVAERLPTLHAAESMLRGGGPARRGRVVGGRHGDLDSAENVLELVEGQEEVREEPRAVGEVRRHLALHRRRVNDADRWLEWATDPEAASCRAAVEDALTEVVGRAEDIAATYEVDDRPDGETVHDHILEIRYMVGSRGSRLADRARSARAESRPLLGLLDLLEWQVEFESVDLAVEATTERLDRPEFPTGDLVDEKRRAADRLESLADAPATARHLASRADGIVRNGRVIPRAADSDVDVDVVANAYLRYAVVAEWADRAVERGDELSARLRAEQS